MVKPIGNMVFLLTLLASASTAFGDVPPTPTGLTVVGTTGNVLLSWNGVATATGYHVQRRTASTPLIVIGSPSIAAYSDGTVTNGVTYYYSVAAFNSSGTSRYASVEVGVTPLAVPALSQPSNGASITGTSVTLAWNPVTGATNYAISVGRGAGGQDVLADYELSASTYTLTGLGSGPYYWRVNALGLNSLSYTSSERSFTVSSSPPSTPTNLNAIGTTGSVILGWNIAANATGYRVQRRTASSGFTVIGSSDVNGYNDTSVVNGTTYFYSVYAYNSAGNSSASSEVSVTPLAAPVLVEPPSGAVITGNSANLQWNRVIGATNYAVSVGKSSGTSDVIDSAETPSLGYALGNIAAGTYYWRVCALAQNSLSSFSAEHSFEVKAAPVPDIRVEPLRLEFTQTAPAPSSATAAAGTTSQFADIPVPEYHRGEFVPDEVIIRFHNSTAATLLAQHLLWFPKQSGAWQPRTSLPGAPSAVISLQPFRAGLERAVEAISKHGQLGRLSQSGSLQNRDAGTLSRVIESAFEPCDPMGSFIVKLAPGEDPRIVAKALSEREDVVYCQPNPIAVCAAPNDPFYPRMWNLERLNVPQAWTMTDNTLGTVRVCVIDTGVRITHEDLLGRTADPVDTYLGNGDAYADSDSSNDDLIGHGTACAGIIAAIRDNSFLMAGIAPVTIVPVNGYSGNDGQGRPTVAWVPGISAGVNRGARIISMSLAGSNPGPAGLEALEYARLHDVLICASAGNDDGSVDSLYPAAYEQVICVGATDDSNRRVRKSIWGWGSNYGQALDVCAPGEGRVGANSDAILTLAWSTDQDYRNNFNGTSAAAPQVAGVCALIRHINPLLSAAEVRSMVEGTARDGIGVAGEDTLGWDPYYGHGLIDAEAAVNLALPAEGQFTVINDGHGDLQITSIAPADPSVDWILLNVADRAFTLTSGNRRDVSVTIDWAKAPAGVVIARLSILSNVPGKSPYPGGVDVVTTKMVPEEPVLSVSPVDGFSAAGRQGGPFSPSGATYQVSNAGGGTLDWSVSANVNWLSFTKTGGSVTTAPDSVTVSLNGNADILTAGTHNATISFNNGTDVHTRPVQLTVTPPPTGSLTVIIEPSDARAAGAQWKVDSGAWQNSGATVNSLSAGSHSLEFSTVPGWEAPPGENVTIMSGQPSVLTKVYRSRVVRLEGSFDFGDVLVNTTATRELTIYNDGTDALPVVGIAYPGGFSGAWSGSIEPKDFHVIDVTFSPTIAQVYDGFITVNCSMTSGVNTISVSGRGVQPVLAVTPLEGMACAGPAGGPFEPSSIHYQVSNAGSGTLNWTVTCNQSWLTVNPTQGTAPGSADVSLNAAANSLPAGTHTATITFSGNGSVETRQVQLTVSQDLCHPADANRDFLVDINELTAYGAAWRRGSTWPVPPSPIDINYVSNAGLLWRKGGTYHYDQAQSAPQCWQPGSR